MENNGHANDEQLRRRLRDYYGTAMFNGNPMAMMELEEAERASGEELRRIAQANGIDPEPRYRDPATAPYREPNRNHNAPHHPSTGIGISVITRTQTIGPAATRFFDSSYAQHDTGFFAGYGQALKRKTHASSTSPAEPTEE